MNRMLTAPSTAKRARAEGVEGGRTETDRGRDPEDSIFACISITERLVKEPASDVRNYFHLHGPAVCIICPW